MTIILYAIAAVSVGISLVGVRHLARHPETIRPRHGGLIIALWILCAAFLALAHWW